MGSNENTKLCDFTSHNNSGFICTPIAPPATSTPSYEIKPALLNLVMKDQFSGAGEDAALNLNNFVELCDMQKYKEVDGDIVKLKLFAFSLRGRAKEWLQSLPRDSIDSWDKCKDAFIGKYYPPAKMIQLRSKIMNFRQMDNEHVAQAWERMKTLVKNCPTHGLTTWMVIQTFYAGLNFTSQNLLDSAAGGTFMSTTLGAATKLLDEMILNYSQWHTERSPTAYNELCMKGVLKCMLEGDERRFRSVKHSSLGMPMCTPNRYSRRLKRLSLGMPPRHPLLHQQSSVCPSLHYIFITSCVMCYAWSVLLFSF